MDLQQLNDYRKLSGLEPLDKLPEETSPSDNPPSKTAEELAAEEELKKKNNPTNTPPEIDDAALLDILKKRGIHIDSLDKLKPADAPDHVPTEEEIEVAKMTFGLNNGFFTKKVYDSYVVDSKDPYNLVYADYYADAKKEDPTLTDDAIQEEFKEIYGLDADPATRRYLRGQKDLKSRSKELLNEKYSKVLSVDSAYNSHESAQKAEKDRQKAILAATPKYMENVNAAIADLGKITAKFDEKESYEVSALVDSIAAIKESFLKPEVIQTYIEAGYDKNALKEIAFNILLKRDFPILAQEIAIQYYKKHASGVHGIPPIDPRGNSGDVVLTDAQKAYQSENKKHNPVPATAN